MQYSNTIYYLPHTNSIFNRFFNFEIFLNFLFYFRLDWTSQITTTENPFATSSDWWTRADDVIGHCTLLPNWTTQQGNNSSGQLQCQKQKNHVKGNKNQTEPKPELEKQTLLIEFKHHFFFGTIIHYFTLYSTHT